MEIQIAKLRPLTLEFSHSKNVSKHSDWKRKTPNYARPQKHAFSPTQLPNIKQKQSLRKLFYGVGAE